MSDGDISDDDADNTFLDDPNHYKLLLKQLKRDQAKYDEYSKLFMPTAVQDEILSKLTLQNQMKAESRIKSLKSDQNHYETKNNKHLADSSRHAKLYQALKDSFGVNVWDALAASVGPKGYLHEWLKALAGHYTSAVPGSSKSSWIKDFHVLTLNRPKDRLISFNAMSSFVEKLNKRIMSYREVFRATNDIKTANDALECVLRALLIDKLRNTLPTEYSVYQAFANDVMLKGESYEDGDVNAIMATFSQLLNLHESQNAQEQKDKPTAQGKRKSADVDLDEPAAAMVAGAPKKTHLGKGKGGSKPNGGSKNTVNASKDAVDVAKFTHQTKSIDGKLFWFPSKQKFLPHPKNECWALNPHLRRPYQPRGGANAANPWSSAPPPWMMYGPGYMAQYPPQGQSFGFKAGQPQWQGANDHAADPNDQEQQQQLQLQRGTQFRSAANNTLDQNLGRQHQVTSRTNVAYPVGVSGARSYCAQVVEDDIPLPPPTGHVGPYPPPAHNEPRPRAFMGMVRDIMSYIYNLIVMVNPTPQAKTITFTGPLMRASLSSAVDNRVATQNLKAVRSAPPSHPAQVLALTDSGCTQLMSPIGIVLDDMSSGFIELTGLDNYAISVADDHVVYATGVGTFRQMLDEGGFLIIHDALHVPVMGCTLVSVAQLMATNRDHLVVFSHHRCIVWNPIKDELRGACPLFFLKRDC